MRNCDTQQFSNTPWKVKRALTVVYIHDCIILMYHIFNAGDTIRVHISCTERQLFWTRNITQSCITWVISHDSQEFLYALMVQVNTAFEVPERESLNWTRWLISCAYGLFKNLRLKFLGAFLLVILNTFPYETPIRLHSNWFTKIVQFFLWKE